MGENSPNLAKLQTQGLKDRSEHQTDANTARPEKCRKLELQKTLEGTETHDASRKEREFEGQQISYPKPRKQVARDFPRAKDNGLSVVSSVFGETIAQE